MTEHRRERGQTVVIFTIAIVPMLALVGLVVDIGWAYFRRQAAQAAADSAAMAAVLAAQASSPNAIACGSNSVACQSPTACGSPIPSPPANNLQNACLYAQENGFLAAGSGRQNVTIEANTTSPAPLAPGVAVKYWVTVRINETEPQLFSAIFGNMSLTTGAHSTAAIFNPNTATCVWVLAPTQAAAVSMNGTTSVQTGCNLWVNSNNSSAVTLVGSASIAATGGASVKIVGNWSGTGGATISPAPNTGANISPDPFAGMTPPPVGACTSPGVSQTGGTTTIDPGVYCGAINLGGNASLTLNPGLYVLENGLSMAGGTSISGSGVTLYIQGGGISMTGGSNVNLTAPVSGPWAGILIYQNPSDSTAGTLTGGASQQLSGTVYMPTASLTYAGGSSTQADTATLVCYTISFAGNSYFKQGASSPYASGAVGPTLIE